MAQRRTTLHAVPPADGSAPAKKTAAKRATKPAAKKTTTPRKPRPKTLAQAAEDGTYLEILIAQRREMIADVKGEKGPAKAALHRQIALASKEIAALQAEKAQEDEEDAEGEAPDEAFDAEAL